MNTEQLAPLTIDGLFGIGPELPAIRDSSYGQYFIVIDKTWGVVKHCVFDGGEWVNHIEFGIEGRIKEQ